MAVLIPRTRIQVRGADAVRVYLIREYGVDSARLQAVGKGETVPMDTNDTPEGRQNNRRVEPVKLG